MIETEYKGEWKEGGRERERLANRQTVRQEVRQMQTNGLPYRQIYKETEGETDSGET